MAVDKDESAFEKVKDFFTQKPEDRAYEDLGGDDRVPMNERTDDPKADANRYAHEAGEELPYPGYQPEKSEVAEGGEVGLDGDTPGATPRH